MPRSLHAQLPQFGDRPTEVTVPEATVIDDRIPDTPVDETSPSAAYLLGAGDTIALDVFNVPEYSQEYAVLVDGTLNLPLIGRVSVAGLSLAQAEAEILRQYTPILARPILQLRLRVTGHSLGGGLAAFAAVAHGLEVITYNAAGVHDDLLSGRGRSRADAEALARNYFVAGELVSVVQRGKLPDALGVQIQIPAIDEDGAPLGDRPGPRRGAALHHVNAACRGMQALERELVEALRAAGG